MAVWVILIVAVLATAILWANRPRRLIIDAALPASFPAKGFSHDSFEELLQTYVTADGRVDYGRWQQFSASTSQLDSYLAAVSRYSPSSAPDRFSSRNDELAYWMYGYNAYVIKSVLDRWPIESVTDVKAPIEVVKGMGFFYQQRFSFGGEFLSLLAVENDKIRKNFTDPRIHFVLNCASESCPIARPNLPVGEELEHLLQQASREFINDRKNVYIDHVNKVVYLSTIFKWFEDDFVTDIRMAGKPLRNGLLAYIAQYASDALVDDVARASDYKIEYREYDWKLNSMD